MIKNYLLVALRSLRKNKSYIIINTFGLGIALACCITAYLLLAFNIEFDSFHSDQKVERIFKVHTHIREKDGKMIQNNNAPIMLAPTAAQEIAGIERFTRYVSDGGLMRNGDKAFSEGIVFVDSTFFDMFDYPLVHGDHKAFKDKRSIFISEKLADKYFEEGENPVGKMLILNFANEFEVEVMVGGVLKRVPINNSFGFDALMRIENFLDLHKISVDNWGDWRDPSTFVELASAENAANVSKQLSKYVPIRNEAKKDATVTEYKLEHFKANFTGDDIGWGYANVRIEVAPLIIFVSMAGLILLIACFNLTNTSIAMTAKRLKEVGIRKTVGAVRHQIVSQFLLETVMTITLSLAVGLLMAQWIVPAFTEMWDFPYALKDLSGVNLFISLMILIFFASILAGMYPALFNSKFKPVALLKGQVKIGSSNVLTQILVSLQFALSVIVLIGGVIFIQNSAFQEEIDFGYEKDRVIVVSIQSRSEFEAMENAISGNPKIQEISVSDHQLGWGSYDFPFKLDTAEYRAQHMGVGNNYFNTMGMKLIQGRFPNLKNASDRTEAVVVNRAFIDKFSLKDPIDQIITVHEAKRHIVGVIENHVDNLYRSKDAEPFVFYPADTTALKNMQVRAEKSDLAEIKTYLESTWKKLFPTKAFQAQFQEEILLGQTRRFNGNLRTIFLFLTVLGGLLSASGIFSLASLSIAKRTKEIGIRKALGASVSNVVALLNQPFVIILTASGLIGSGLGYVLTNLLLDEIYKHHIPIGVIPVAFSALTIFVIGILTTSVTILKAARANPVETLRND
ncbi:MAG TPA: ABC transporter permease [Ohtaekwangia sp.]